MSIRQQKKNQSGKITSICGVTLASILTCTALADSIHQVSKDTSKKDIETTKKADSSYFSSSDESSSSSEKKTKDEKHKDESKDDEELSEMLNKTVESANSDAKKFANASSQAIKDLLSGKNGSALASLTDTNNDNGLLKLSDVKTSDNHQSQNPVSKITDTAKDVITSPLKQMNTALASEDHPSNNNQENISFDKSQSGTTDKETTPVLPNVPSDDTDTKPSIPVAPPIDRPTDDGSSTDQGGNTGGGTVPDTPVVPDNPGNSGDSGERPDPIKQYTLEYNIIAQVLNKNNEKLVIASGSKDITSNECDNGIYHYDFTQDFEDFLKQGNYEVAGSTEGLTGTADFNQGDHRTVTITIGVNAKDQSSDTGSSDNSSTDKPTDESPSTTPETPSDSTNDSSSSTETPVAPPKDEAPSTPNSSNNTDSSNQVVPNESTATTNLEEKSVDTQPTVYTEQSNQDVNSSAVETKNDSSENIVSTEKVNVPETSDTKMSTTVKSSSENQSSEQSKQMNTQVNSQSNVQSNESSMQ